MVSTKFTVAVINHADDIRFDGFYKMDQFANTFYGKRRPCLIAFGTLDRHQLCPFIDRFSDIIIVKITVFPEGLPGGR